MLALYTFGYMCRAVAVVSSFADADVPAADEKGAGNCDQENVAAAFELPEVPDLPTEGVDYCSLPEEDIKQLVLSLTSLVFYRVQQ